MSNSKTTKKKTGTSSNAGVPSNVKAARSQDEEDLREVEGNVVDTSVKGNIQANLSAAVARVVDVEEEKREKETQEAVNMSEDKGNPIANFTSDKETKSTATDKKMTDFDIDDNGNITSHSMSTIPLLGKSDRYNNARLYVKLTKCFEFITANKSDREAFEIKKQLRDHLSGGREFFCEGESTPLKLKRPDGLDGLATTLRLEFTRKESIELLEGAPATLRGDPIIKRLLAISNERGRFEEEYDFYIFTLQILFVWLSVAPFPLNKEIDKFINSIWRFNPPATQQYFKRFLNFGFSPSMQNLLDYLNSPDMTCTPERRIIDTQTLVYDERDLNDTYLLDQLLSKVETIQEIRDTLSNINLDLSDRQDEDKYLRNPFLADAVIEANSMNYIKKYKNYRNVSLREIVGEYLHSYKADSSIKIGFNAKRAGRFPREVCEVIGMDYNFKSYPVETNFFLTIENCNVNKQKGGTRGAPRIKVHIIEKTGKTERVIQESVIPTIQFQFAEVYKMLSDYIGQDEHKTIKVYKDALSASTMTNSYKILSDYNTRKLNKSETEDDPPIVTLDPIQVLVDNQVLQLSGYAVQEIQGRGETQITLQLKKVTDSETEEFSILNDQGVLIANPLFKRRFKPTYQTQPYVVCKYGLNVINKDMIDAGNWDTAITEDFYGARPAPNGLYRHQQEFVKAIFTPLKRDEPSAIYLGAGVGEGKTTAFLAAVKAVKAIPEQPYLIYACSKIRELSGMFLRCKSVGFTTVASYYNKNWEEGRIVFRYNKSSSNKKGGFAKLEEVIDGQQKCDVLICHTRMLLAFLAVIRIARANPDDPAHKASLRRFTIVIDEIDPEEINSLTEHALGAILASDQKRFAIMSASITQSGPIQYLMRRQPFNTYIASPDTLVPTETKQFNGTTIPPIGWFDKEKYAKELLIHHKISHDYDWIDSPSESEHDKRFKELIKQELEEAEDRYIQLAIDKIKENSFLRRRICYKDIKDCLFPTGTDSDKIAQQKIAFRTKMNRAGIFDPSNIYLLFHGHKHLSISKREEYRPEEEIKCIKQSKHYTLVACEDPSAYAYMIYGEVYNYIRTIIPSFIQQMKEFKFSEMDLRARLGNADAGSGKEKDLNTTKAVEAFVIYSSKVNNKQFKGTFIEYLEKELGMKPSKASNFEVLYKAQKDKEPIEEELTKLKNDRSNYQYQMIRGIAKKLHDIGIYHHKNPSLEFEKAVKFIEGQLDDYPYEVMGVFIRDKYSTENPPQQEENRLFYDNTGARGMDLPLKAVVITKEFELKNNVDTINQMTGRCGRPTKSTISIVYMSAECHSKLLWDDTSPDTRDIMLRTKFYLQDDKANNITEPIGTIRDEVRVNKLLIDIRNKIGRQGGDLWIC